MRAICEPNSGIGRTVADWIVGRPQASQHLIQIRGIESETIFIPFPEGAAWIADDAYSVPTNRQQAQRSWDIYSFRWIDTADIGSCDFVIPEFEVMHTHPAE